MLAISSFVPSINEPSFSNFKFTWLEKFFI